MSDIDRLTPPARAAVAARALSRVLPLRSASDRWPITAMWARQTHRAVELLKWVAPGHLTEVPAEGGRDFDMAAALVCEAATAALHLALPGNDDRPGCPHPAKHGHCCGHDHLPGGRDPLPYADELEALLGAVKAVTAGVLGAEASAAAEQAVRADLTAAVAGEAFGPLA